MRTSLGLYQLLMMVNAGGTPTFLPLDVDSINENDSVANPDPTPRIASAHKSRFVEVVLVECWMEAVYYCLLLRKLLRSRDVFY